MCWIAKIEYCEPTISRTEFVVLVERKSKPFISCIRLCQVNIGQKNRELGVLPEFYSVLNIQ